MVVDEAQLFAPSGGGEVAEEVRRASLSAMTNLMCRGRKRGLAGIIATQRLAKLAKNVAAEASNFLMGRTFLDIDMARAADLLGMERRQAETIRDLERGHFLGLGPAISRRPLAVRIGSVRTGSRAVSHALAPLPTASSEEMQALLHDDGGEQDALPPAEPSPAAPPAETLLSQIEADPGADEAQAEPMLFPDGPDSAETEAALVLVLNEMAEEEDCTFQPPAALFQDFVLRCRMRRIAAEKIDMNQFRRRFALAMAGMADERDRRWDGVRALARSVPDDLLAPFLILARAAMEHAPCPDDEALARIYGTRSPGRIRRLLDHFEKSGLMVVRMDYGGRRSIGFPDLGLTTAPMLDA